MRLILDLDDKLVSDMQDYCEYHGITINYLIENLFNRFVMICSPQSRHLKYQKSGLH